MTSTVPRALIIGVGAQQGLGAALARRLAREGLHVWLAGRTAAKLEAVAATIARDGGQATPLVLDATQEAEVVALFARLGAAQAPLEIVIYNAGNNRRLDLLDTSAETFEDYWRVGCLGGFIVGREAARHMLRADTQERRTILYTGASASLRGRPGFAHFAVAKAGLRVLAQAMAREYGPRGLHVGHVVIDGGIKGERLMSAFPDRVAAAGENGLLELDAIAEAYWQLHIQARSAWTFELDLRPYKEPF